MQKFIYTAFICLTFCLAKAQTVYIAETGKKYHTKSCPAVKSQAREMSLKEARKKGYEPCISCGAEKIVPAKEEKPAAKKKEEKEEKPS